jgi:hypothetical protein
VLVTLGVPLLLLSGTVPVPHEDQLFTELCVAQAYAQVLRRSTVRQNTVCSVVDLATVAALNVYSPGGFASFVFAVSRGI